MTAIALCASPGNPLFARSTLEDILQRALILEPAAPESWHSTGIGLGAIPFATSSVNPQHKPLGELPNGYSISFDGVLDNRRELLEALSEDPSDSTPLSDAKLALMGYLRWGQELPNRLVGCFAFAIWDAKAKGVFCARDHLGVRSLFYSDRCERLLVASQVRQLVDGTDDLLDESFFADFLSWGFPVSGSTPYRRITRLPAGHALWWDGSGARVTRYWRPLSLPMLRYRSNDDYVEEFRDLFFDAVRTALATPGGIVAELSGGLDSSSIVSVLGQLEESGEAEPSRISTLTVTYDEAHHSDERAWCKLVSDQYGLDADHVDGDNRFLADLASGARYWDEPSGQMIFFSLYRTYHEVIGRRRATLLLSGAGAETSMLSEAPEPIHLADLLLQLRLPTLAGEFRGWRRAKHLPFINMLARGILLPLITPRRRSFFSRSLDARQVAEWIDPDFAKRHALLERVRGRWSDCRSASRARSFQFEKVWRISGFMFRGYLEKLLSIRYPFLHRPLVEYLLRVPFEHKVRPGEHKALLRRAMRGILPEPIRKRMDKRGPGHAFYLAMEREWTNLEPMLKDPILASFGFVDRDRLYRTAQLARLGHCSDAVLLGSTLALEFWLREALGESIENRETA